MKKKRLVSGRPGTYVEQEVSYSVKCVIKRNGTKQLQNDELEKIWRLIR